MNAVEPLYTVKEAAKRLNCSRGFAYSALAQGKLGHYRLGRKMLIGEKHIRDYLDGNEQPPEEPKPPRPRKPTTNLIGVLNHLIT